MEKPSILLDCRINIVEMAVLQKEYRFSTITYKKNLSNVIFNRSHKSVSVLSHLIYLEKENNKSYGTTKNYKYPK